MEKLSKHGRSWRIRQMKDGKLSWVNLGRDYDLALIIAEGIKNGGCVDDIKQNYAFFRMEWVKPLQLVVRRRSKRKGAKCLTVAELEEIAIRSNSFCEVSGIAFDLSGKGDYSRNPYKPSLDRIDNSLGYEKDNVRLVCTSVNLAMNEFGVDVLMKISKAVHQKHAIN